MTDSYINLVNKLRDRFNEPRIVANQWNTLVGFNNYCKDAVNYAYQDILNAEMEWPFCHRETTMYTAPGKQRYDVELPGGYSVKEIDWDSFYINLNKLEVTVANELNTITSTTPFIAIPTNVSIWASDLGVKYDVSGLDLTAVDHDPQQAGQYTIKDRVYYFHSDDANVPVRITYSVSSNSTLQINPVQFLRYLSYDEWRQTRVAADLNSTAASGYNQPMFVFKPQNQAQIGFSPVPDKIYSVTYEYWLHVSDMVNPSDTTILPARFDQVLLDGASKYLYDFREDAPLSKAAEDRFNRGLMRMRTELINRSMDMRSSFHWRNSPWTIGGVGGSSPPSTPTENPPIDTGLNILLNQGGNINLNQGGDALLNNGDNTPVGPNVLLLNDSGDSIIYNTGDNILLEDESP